MANVKMTKVEALANAIAIVESNINPDADPVTCDMDELLEKLETMYATEKKRAETASSKRSKKSGENKALSAELLETMEADTEYKASEAGALIGLSTPKATALLRILVEEGSVLKIAKNSKTNIYKVA